MPAEAGRREHAEPDDHDRAEEPADRAGAEALGREQHGEHDERDRDHELLEALSTTSRPSTADSTEIAGVIIPSP